MTISRWRQTEGECSIRHQTSICTTTAIQAKLENHCRLFSLDWANIYFFHCYKSYLVCFGSRCSSTTKPMLVNKGHVMHKQHLNWIVGLMWSKTSPICLKLILDWARHTWGWQKKSCLMCFLFYFESLTFNFSFRVVALVKTWLSDLHLSLHMSPYLWLCLLLNWHLINTS